MISYSEDYDKAFKSSEFWRAALIENVFDINVSDPVNCNKKQNKRFQMKS